MLVCFAPTWGRMTAHTLHLEGFWYNLFLSGTSAFVLGITQGVLLVAFLALLLFIWIIPSVGGIGPSDE